MRPYPCIGLGVYLVPQLRRVPVYPELLQRLAKGQALVDIGCFIGHDLRHLVKDGAPAGNLYGFDIVNFWDLGFDMFKDRGRFDAKFAQVDVMATDGTLAEFEGMFDVISISQVRRAHVAFVAHPAILTSMDSSQVLHQWNWDGQVEACKRLTSLSKPGSLIVGNQIGNLTAQAIALDSIPHPLWRHNEQSFAKLWAEVGLATNTTWECSAWLRSFEEMSWKPEDSAWMEEGVRVLEFAARRMS